VSVSNFTSGVINKPVYFSIDASHAGAGNLEIIVSVNGKNVPNYVQVKKIGISRLSRNEGLFVKK
jgi:filamin